MFYPPTIKLISGEEGHLVTWAFPDDSHALEGKPEKRISLLLTQLLLPPILFYFQLTNIRAFTLSNIHNFARQAFLENAKRARVNRYKIALTNGKEVVGKPYMVQSDSPDFVLELDQGGMENFTLDWVVSIELLRQTS